MSNVSNAPNEPSASRVSRAATDTTASRIVALVTRWGWTLAGCGLVCACGGRVVDTRESEDDPVALSDSPASADRPAGADPRWDPTQLPHCDPEFREKYGFVTADARGRECNWTDGKLCFEDKVPACACACKSADSICLSEFPEPGGRVPVLCN